MFEVENNVNDFHVTATATKSMLNNIEKLREKLELLSLSSLFFCH